MGAMPIRKAFALPRSIPTIRLLDEIGISHSVELVKRMGLPNQMSPFLPSAEGTTEEPLLAMTSAYATFPNGGVRVEPVFIRKVVDRDGNVLESASPKTYKALSEYVAAQVVDLMRGAVTYGPATAASSLGNQIAGTVGTTNEFTDAWFIGFTPTVTCGVWIGYGDSKRPLGLGESGANAALPFWIDFMRDYLKDKPKGKFPPIPDVPDGLRQIQADRSRKHAAELARIASRDGDLLPGMLEPNLDPLEGSGPQAAKPESNPKIIRPPVDTTSSKQEEPLRKGKKGKIDN